LIDETVMAVAARLESVPLSGLRQLDHRGQHRADHAGKSRLRRTQPCAFTSDVGLQRITLGCPLQGLFGDQQVVGARGGGSFLAVRPGAPTVLRR
jgi:hypothetical protein